MAVQVLIEGGQAVRRRWEGAEPNLLGHGVIYSNIPPGDL